MKTLAQILPKALATAHSAVITPQQASDWHPVIDAYEPSLRAAASHAAQFVRDMAARTAPRWLTFTGVPGCGKTMLARQIFEAARAYNPGETQTLWCTGTGLYDESRRRPRRVWLSATEFADRMRSGKEYDLPEYLGADFLVILDDLGATRDTTNFLAEAVYRLCNARLGKWTVFTSNLNATGIATQVDPRVASRLIRDGSVAYRIDAGDYAMRHLATSPGREREAVETSGIHA